MWARLVSPADGREKKNCIHLIIFWLFWWLVVFRPGLAWKPRLGLKAPAWPESPGFGLAWGGFGFLKPQARPKLSTSVAMARLKQLSRFCGFSSQAELISTAVEWLSCANIAHVSGLCWLACCYCVWPLVLHCLPFPLFINTILHCFSLFSTTI